MRKITAADAARWCALAAVYFLAAKLGLKLAFVNASATAFWPPTGIALAAFLIFGRRVWPGIFLGAFLANMTTAGNFATSLGIALGNTLEGLTGAYLVERFAGGKAVFDRIQDTFKFAFLAAGLAPVVSATIGVTSLTLGGFAHWSTFAQVWFTWWLGDASGALVFAPLLILWASTPPPRWNGEKAIELCALFAGLFVLGQIVFGGLISESLSSNPLAFICLPSLLWAAFRFGPRETATVNFALAGVAIVGTLRGMGPFARTDPNASLLLLQSFIGVATVMALAFAAAVLERSRASLALRRSYEELDVQVKQRTAELSKANAELQMFTAVASHDLQEPLHKITSFIELLANRSAAGLDDSGRDMLRRIQGAAVRMSRLVDDLLSLSRVIRDPRPFEDVDLNTALFDVMADLEKLIIDKDVRIEAGPLPTVRAHATQMRQLLQNLIGNAIKFQDPKRPLVVKVGSRVVQSGFIEITVEDNGIGFDSHQAEHIFQPFVSLYVHGEYAGSGIGLAICRRIAVRHSGAITAKSAPGQGASFTITLPYSKPE
jgi:signal transduction histidine kinase